MSGYSSRREVGDQANGIAAVPNRIGVAKRPHQCLQVLLRHVRHNGTQADFELSGTAKMVGVPDARRCDISSFSDDDSNSVMRN